MQMKPASESALFAGLSGAIVMAAAMGFGRFVYTPILPGMMAGAGISAGDAGIIASANFVGYLAGAILASLGWASGRERQVALWSLAANAVLLGLMASTSNLFLFSVVRFGAGVASAFIMIFATSLILARFPGDARVQALHFGGVGFGIALSSLMVFAMKPIDFGIAQWRAEWIVAGALCVLAFVVGVIFIPRPDRHRGKTPAEPHLRWSGEGIRMIVSYGLFGFGYIITATFLVTIARMGGGGAASEFLCWFATGLAVMASMFLWPFYAKRNGLRRTYLTGIALEAVGVVASVLVPGLAGLLIGGIFLGATFIMITAYGLQLSRTLWHESPRRAIGLMTAAFGVGQIIGPVVAGYAASLTGSFTMASLMAAGMLVVAFLVMTLGAKPR
ncbi:YbfB/YjiJ family MFS transporter [Rhizobium sp. NRK18]|uniref:YbfB/YjiJ family MFS transporter n=1 Tax=Rhizobium sp. NRK18 TaxID=2964667 RepID=UPI0021C4AE1E|nr:YbfB/YjiJ family MFS transporter [Rhizobium sp. NRK18]MCQ2003535.1 YbfB/YjiJ family MFS transporter [Rhizobium sp. NRK18]